MFQAWTSDLQTSLVFKGQRSLMLSILATKFNNHLLQKPH